MKRNILLLVLVILLPAGSSALEEHPPLDVTCSSHTPGWGSCELDSPCPNCVDPETNDYNFSMVADPASRDFTDCHLFMVGTEFEYHRVGLVPDSTATRHKGCDKWYSFLAQEGGRVARTLRCKTTGSMPSSYVVEIGRQVPICPP